MAEKSLYENLKDLNDFEKELAVEKNQLIQKALENGNPKDIVFANELIRERSKTQKSFILDPLNSNDSGGYRNRAWADVSFGMLRSMAKNTGLISAIIATRKEQVANYCDYSTESTKPGWCIEKNVANYFGESEEYENQKKLSKEDREEVRGIISFILNCGVKGRLYHGDDFNSFLRKFVDDSLTLDQVAFEIVPSKLLKPYEFFMVDSATIRFASAQFEKEQEQIEGYSPYAVQLYQGNIKSYYYPWELCVGIRNPSTNVLYNGYGISELELLVKVVTYILYSESYTGKFFSQGSNPKGLFIAEGNLSEDKIQEFRQTWQTQISGISGAHKIPILSGGNLKWVDMQQTNKDMEFSNWLDYLTRLTLAIYKIDGKELGYNFDSGESVNYESSIQEKITYSKEKGLIPLLKFIEKNINKYIVYPMYNSKYKFTFTGVDNSEKLIEDLDLAKVKEGVMSWKEYRRKHGLPTELEEDDFLLNSNWIQFNQSKQQAQQGGVMGMSGMPGMENMQGTQIGNDGELNKNTPSIFSEFIEENPFMRDLDNFVKEHYPNDN